MEDIGKVVAREGPAAGIKPEGFPAAGPLPPDPPSTNRGSVVSLGEGVYFHPDYLKLTVFKGLGEVQAFVEREVLEPCGFGFNWVEKGPAARWSSILYGEGPVILYSPKPSGSIPEYSMIELKGEGCEAVGNERVAGLLGALRRSEWRWRAVRFDGAWDRVPFAPGDVDRANREGQFVSRVFNVGDRGWRENAEGATAYLPDPEKRGSKSRLLRVYDKRGFTRCELEARGDEAESCVAELSELDVSRWSAHCLGYLLRAVDYRDVKSGRQVNRCERLPWWEAFVSDAIKVKKLREKPAPEERRVLPIGRSEAAIMRCARQLEAIIRAFGVEYVRERIGKYAGRSWGAEDEAFVDELKKWKYSGLAGLPTRPDERDELPF